MKTLFLSGALLLGSIMTTTAQSYGESFFVNSGPNSFTLGDLNGQRGWNTVTSEGATITGYTIIQPVPYPEPGNDGPNSGVLKISADAHFGPAPEGKTFGAFTPSLIHIPFEASGGIMAITILIESDDNAQTAGAVYEVQMQDAANSITSKVGFFPDGSIKALELNEGILSYQDTGLSWEDHKWVTLAVTYNFTPGTIKYTANGQIHLGHTLTGVALDHFSILHNNMPGSTAYVRRIYIVGLGFTLGIPDAGLTPKISVFPNPTSGLITIDNTGLLPLESISVADLNGRTIKAFTPDADVAAPQINISDLAAGMYLLTFSVGNERITNKIIKK